MSSGPNSSRPSAAGRGTVYLIHFDEPYKHARHYLGWAHDLAARVKEHQEGRGARLMEVIKDAGISWRVARTWPGTRNLERAIKERHNTPRLCPECTPQPQPVTRGRSAAQPAPQPQAKPPPQRQETASWAQAADQRHAEWRAARQITPCERGAAQARQLIGRQIEAGLSADEIEAANTRTFRDYDPAVATPQARERHRGYQVAAAELIAGYRQARQPQAGSREAELEVG